MERFHNYSNVNRRMTVPNRSILLGSRRRGGPDWYGTVPLASVNSSVPLASSSTVIFSGLIGVSDTAPLHSTSSHHINDCEMLQDSRGALAVNRRIEIVGKSSSTRTFLLITQCLCREIHLFADRSVRWQCTEQCKVETAKKSIARSNELQRR